MKKIILLILITFVSVGASAQRHMIHYPVKAFTSEDSTIMRLMNNSNDLKSLRDSLNKLNLQNKYDFIEDKGEFELKLNKNEQLSIQSVDTLEWIVRPPIIAEPDPNKPSEPLPDLPIDRTKSVGSIPYTSDIVNGAVTYTVPIQVPESSKGLEPNVALHYNSMGGNDMAGYGWSLSATSIITYTAGNYFYDGESAMGETDGENARFMLDGLRLLESFRDSKRITYETETGHIKVYSYIPSKKYYFEVLYPDGRKGIFGDENKSQASQQYPLVKMTDRFSNYIDYTYGNSGGFHQVSTIKYGSNGNQLGYIKFDYENRDDSHRFYKAGWPAILSKLLKSIKVYYGTSTLLYTYTLEHTYTDVNLLSKIRCKSISSELNPLIFNYGHNRTDKGNLQKHWGGSLGKHYDSAEPIMSRFKMNTKDDKEQLIVYPEKDYSIYGETNKNKKGSEFGSTFPHDLQLLVHTDIYGGENALKIIWSEKGFQTLTGVDIYGNGNEDLVKINYEPHGDDSEVIITTYSNSFSESKRKVYLPGRIKEDKYISPYPRIFIFGDFNGDGKTKLLALSSNISPREEKLSTNSAVHILHLNANSQLCETEIPGFNMFNDIAFAADITGNGKSELCVINSSGLHVYSLIDKKFKKIASSSSLTPDRLKNRKFLLGDINLDGKTDILISPLRDQHTSEKLHEGECTQACRYSSKIDVTPHGLEVYYYQGKYCYVHSEYQKVYKNDAFKWECLSFTGDGFVYTTANFDVPYDWGYNYLLQDVNGDKFPDLITNENGTISVILNKNSSLEGKKESTTIKIEKNSYLFSGDKSVHNQASTGQFLVIRQGWVTPVSFSRNEEMERLMTSFYDSYGVKTQYKYNSFADIGTTDYSYYSTPLVTFRASFPVVNTVTTSTSYPENQTIRSEKYSYYNPVYHKQTRAFMGFRKIITYDNIRKKQAEFSYAPDKWGVLSGYYAPRVEMRFTYKVNGTSRSSRSVLMTEKVIFDTLKGHDTTTKYEYDYYGNPTYEHIETYHYMNTEANKNSNNYPLSTQALSSSSAIDRDRDNDQSLQIPYEPIYPDPIIPIYPLFPDEIDLSFRTKQTIRRTYDNIYTGSEYLLGNLLSETITREDQNQNTITTVDKYTFNSSYLPATHTQLYNNVQTLHEEFIYDEKGNGNLLRHNVKNYQSTTPLTTSYEYDNLGRPIKVVQPMINLYTQTAYNSKGLVDKITDHNGLCTSYKYDVWGNATTITYPDGATEKNAYSWSKASDEGIWTVTRTMTNQPTSRTCYDQLGREIKSTVLRFDGVEMSTVKQYNQKGLLSHESRPYRTDGTRKWNYMFYDEWDRITQKRFASGNVEYYSYDNAAVTVKKDKVETTTLYDAEGKVFTVKDPAGTITYSYRPDGQIYKITAPEKIVTTIEFDEAGRKIALDDPSTGRTSYAYDKAGNVCEEKLTSGKIIRYQYDIYNRLIGKDVDGDLNTTYTYNVDNLPIKEKSDNQCIVYEYDTYGRLISHTDSILERKWLKKEMTYLTGGFPASVAYTSAEGKIATENYTYKNGYLTEVKLNNSQSIWKLIEEDSYGNPVKAETGPLQRSYTYDTNGFPSARKVKKDQQIIQDFAYSFNRTTCNLNWRKDNRHRKQEFFKYDELNRLVSFGYNSSNLFDDNKINHWEDLKNVEETELKYLNQYASQMGSFENHLQENLNGNDNRPIITGDLTDGYTVDYDNLGNILRFSEIAEYEYFYKTYPYQAGLLTLEDENAIPYQTQEISYNAMRRPSTIAEYNFYTTFAYGNEHQRIKMVIAKNNNNWLTRYYLGNYETEESDKGTTERIYLSGDAYSAPAVYVKEDGIWNIHYICRDYLGSITHITDKDGNLQQELSYDAWGRLRNPETQEIYNREDEPDLFLGRGYTAHEHLTPFGLINMNARLYDPVLGRFLSPDPYVQAPYNTQNFNRYSYALNNPLRYTDESGEIFGFITGFFKGMYKHPFKPHKWFERGARDFVNDMRIIQGLFKGNFKQVISRFTWELPQTLLGVTSSFGYNWIGDVKSVDYWGGATVLTTTNMAKGKGVTLGSYIIASYNIKANPNNPLFQHEYGHYLQSQAWGWAFLPRAGIPSLFDTKSNGNHKFHPIEQDANARAFIYFNKNVEGFYKTKKEYDEEKSSGWDFDKNSGWAFDKNPLGIYGYNIYSYIDYNNPEQMKLVNNLTIKSNMMDYFSFFLPYFPVGPLTVGIHNHSKYKNYYKP